MSVLEVPTTHVITPSTDPTVHRLVVAWQHPVSRKISPVGFLTREGAEYQFTYIQNAVNTTDFRPLLGFPDFGRRYTAGEMFPLFAQRAMDPRRPDYERYVERLGLSGEPTAWVQISRSQGRRQGDTLQLLPEPTLDGNTLTCVFLVNGMRHAHEDPHILEGRTSMVTREQIENALAKLTAGDELLLAREPGNEKNSLALMVTGPEVPVGWVPDLLVADLQRCLSSARVRVVVEHVNGPDAPWQLRLLARLRVQPADGFRFFTGAHWAPLAS